tara:strand:- start:6134 stop:6463 length:330 start_codon:yes stop_codon:yes gene_type:complete
MAYPQYRYVKKVNAYTDPVERNKGVVIFGSPNNINGTTGGAVIGFFDENGETGAVDGRDIGVKGNNAANIDGVAGTTAEVAIAQGDTLFLPISIGNVGGITNCHVKILN